MSMQQKFWIILIILVVVLGMSACMTQVTPFPTSSPIPTITEMPTDTVTPTATPEPTATATPEPTKINPNQLADQIGIYNPEPPGEYASKRTFKIENRDDGLTYLVDTFNKVPKAVQNKDGTWRKLDYHNPEDAETMYGWMVYKKNYDFFEEGSLDSCWEDPAKKYNYTRFTIDPIYLGDWLTRKTVDFDGREVTVAYLVTGLRIGDDKQLRIVEHAFNVIGMKKPHSLTTKEIGTYPYEDLEMASWDIPNLDLKPGESLKDIQMATPKKGSSPKLPPYIYKVSYDPILEGK